MSSPAVLCAVTSSSRTYTACGRPSPQLYSCVWPFLLPQSLASEYIRPRGLGPVIQISGIDNRSRGQRVLSSLSTADSPSRHVHTPHRTTSAPSFPEAFSVSSETAEASPTSISSSSDSGSTLSSKDYARRNEWRAALRIQRQRLADEADRQMTVLGVKMNEMTGYKAVEQLKDLVHNRGEWRTITFSEACRRE